MKPLLVSMKKSKPRRALATSLDDNAELRAALLKHLHEAAKDRPIAVIHQIIQMLEMS